MTDPEPSTSPLAPHLSAQSDGEVSPRRIEMRRIAGAVRRLVEDLVGADADPADLRDVADELEEVATRFRRDRPRSMYDGFAEAAVAGGELDPFFDHSPLIGQANPVAPPITVTLSGTSTEGIARGEVTFGSAYEGPPGCVHGGFVAAAFDEVLGAAQTLSGAPGMTGTLTIVYRRPTPLHAPLVFEGRFDRRERRKVFTSGVVRSGDTVTAEATAIFVTIDAPRFRALNEERQRRLDEAGGAEGPAAIPHER